MADYRLYTKVDAINGESTLAGHKKHNQRFADIQSWFPVTTSAAQYEAMLLDAAKTGYTFTPVLRSDVPLEHDDGNGTSGQVLQSDGDGTTSWTDTIRSNVALQHDDGNGTSGQVLQSDGDGTTSWATVGTLTDGDKGDITVATSGTAWSIDADAVVTAKILDANVTAAKLASDAVTTVKILDANVTTAKIADNAVTFAKMQNLSANRIIGSDTAGDPVQLAVGGTAVTNGGLVITNIDGGGPYLRPGGMRTSGLKASFSGANGGNFQVNTVSRNKVKLNGSDTGSGFADEATLMPSVAANSLVVGSTFEFKSIGYFTTTGTPTMKLDFGIDNDPGGGTFASYTEFADTGAITVPVSGMSGMVELYGTFNVTTIGASAKGIGNCYIALTDDSSRIVYKLAPPTQSDINSTPLITGHDTTVVGEITATFTWGTASASNAIHWVNTQLIQLK